MHGLTPLGARAQFVESVLPGYFLDLTQALGLRLCSVSWQLGYEESCLCDHVTTDLRAILATCHACSPRCDGSGRKWAEVGESVQDMMMELAAHKKHIRVEGATYYGALRLYKNVLTRDRYASVRHKKRAQGRQASVGGSAHRPTMPSMARNHPLPWPNFV